MSFTFRSMFQSSPDASQGTGSAASGTLQSAFSTPQQTSSTTMPVSAPPLNAASPFGAPLFKFAPGEAAAASPMQQSPFAASAAQSTGAPLTVADILPLLPPEIARLGALPMEQPVAVSPQVLSDALRGGQAALPIFEIYRVCPALFQTPISPQDPRMIPLPASKLPYLIAATTQAGGPAPSPNSSASPFSMPASPFGATASSPVAEPAQMMSASPSGMMLPPRRQGPPPPLADVPNREAEVPQLSLPGQLGSGAPAFPMSPFAAAGSQMAAGASEISAQPLASSPFTSAKHQAAVFGAAPPASPFGQAAPAAPASPFGQVAPVAPAASAFGQTSLTAQTTSPFGQAAPIAPTTSPFGQASATAPISESPFGTLFGAKAVPTGQPAPDSASARPAQPPAMPMSSAPATSAPLIRICLANLIKGYTSAELGFDPMVVPAWITTAVPSAKVQELASLPVPVAELGLLIDGITDVGFRNVLNTAKREFQLRIANEELNSALAGASAPQTLPNLASLGSNPAQPAAQAPAQAMMRIDPPAQTYQQTGSAFASQPSFETATVPGVNSPFLAPSVAEAVHPAPNAPSISTFGIPAAQPSAPQSVFGMPATALQPLAPKTLDPFSQAQQPAPATQPMFQIPQAELEKVAPVTHNAFFQAAQSAAPQTEAQPTQIHSAFIPPQVTHVQPSAPEPALFYPITETTVLPPERHQEPAQSHTGFASMRPSNPMDEGFSSDQLLGRQPTLEQSWSAAAVAAASGPLGAFTQSETRERSAPVIEMPQELPPKVSIPVFTPPPYEESEFKAPAVSQAKPTPLQDVIQGKRPEPAKAPTRAPSTNSNLGVQMHDTDPDQILLRALLDTDSELTPQKVVEMACGLPGIAACVCIQGLNSISHIGAHKPQAREFQKQATDLAQHLRTLAPLIGIEGAETFTMNSGDRLMTFCFPEGSILGVLHDAEPTLGLRDKITLIARELSRMII